jgi:hypothetical protein
MASRKSARESGELLQAGQGCAAESQQQLRVETAAGVCGCTHAVWGRECAHLATNSWRCCALPQLTSPVQQTLPRSPAPRICGIPAHCDTSSCCHPPLSALRTAQHGTPQEAASAARLGGGGAACTPPPSPAPSSFSRLAGNRSSAPPQHQRRPAASRRVEVATVRRYCSGSSTAAASVAMAASVHNHTRVRRCRAACAYQPSVPRTRRAGARGRYVTCSHRCAQPLARRDTASCCATVTTRPCVPPTPWAGARGWGRVAENSASSGRSPTTRAPRHPASHQDEGRRHRCRRRRRRGPHGSVSGAAFDPILRGCAPRAPAPT